MGYTHIRRRSNWNREGPQGRRPRRRLAGPAFRRPRNSGMDIKIFNSGCPRFWADGRLPAAGDEIVTVMGDQRGGGCADPPAERRAAVIASLPLACLLHPQRR
jgi:hypothetical protein